MTGTLILTRGLPASGKSTWAKAQVLADAMRQTKRVNRDDLRLMINCGAPWSKGQEKLIVAARDAIILEGLQRGYRVICDDTNLQPAVVEHLRSLAAVCDADLVIEDFTHVPLEVCIERDAAREVPVTEKVIRRMWRESLSAA